VGLFFLHDVRWAHLLFRSRRWTIEVRMVVGGDLKFLSNFGNLMGAASRNLGRPTIARVHVPRL
jgi:hypothetical protein